MLVVAVEKTDVVSLFYVLALRLAANHCRHPPTRLLAVIILVGLYLSNGKPTAMTPGKIEALPIVKRVTVHDADAVPFVYKAIGIVLPT